MHLQAELNILHELKLPIPELVAVTFEVKHLLLKP